MSDLLIVVPCRAGSVDVPRKSSQLVDGQPLVSRTLSMLADVGQYTAHELSVVVSTDDPVVAEIAAQHQVPVHRRDASLAKGDVTLSAVVADAVAAMGWTGRVGCAQVTSPWLRAETVAQMLDVFVGGSWTTGSTVVMERELRWLHDGEPKLHGQAVSRQQQGVVSERETGGLRLWVTPSTVKSCPVSSSKHLRWEVTPLEGLDVDTPWDLHVARAAAGRRRILFVVEASEQTGSGHLHRALTLIDHLSQHHVEVCFVDDAPEWAWDAVESHGVIQDAHPSWDALVLGGFDAVVFDRLDTTVTEVAAAHYMGASVVTFEDRGPGSMLADAVINELYAGFPLSGPEWSVLRPEFCGPPCPPPGDGRVLVTFGGTDPAGLNLRVARALTGLVFEGGWMSKVTVVAPPSLYVSNGDLVDGVTWVKTREVPMAALMRKADVVVTSRGRTVTEAMAMGRPVVSIAANVRELSHFHHDGVTYLPPAWQVTDEQIVGAVAGLLRAPEVGEALRAAVPRDGAERIAGLITTLANQRRAA